QETHWTEDARKRLQDIPQPWASDPALRHLADAPSFSIRDLPGITADLHVWDGADGRHTVDLCLNSSKLPGLAIGWAEIPLARDEDSHFAQVADVKQFLEGQPLQQASADPELDRKMAALTPEQTHKLSEARARIR